MDDRRFDDLLRSLATGMSRRGVLAGLSGGLLAALPGIAAADRDDRRDRRGKKRRHRKGKGNNGLPPPAPPCVDRKDCPPGLVCNGGVCGECPTPQVSCGGAGENCFCATPPMGGSRTCAQSAPQAFGTNCSVCPANTTCAGVPGSIVCYKPCGAA